MNPYDLWLPTFVVSLLLIAALRLAVRHEARKLWRTEGPPTEPEPESWRWWLREAWRAVRFTDEQWAAYSAERDARG